MQNTKIVVTVTVNPAIPPPPPLVATPSTVSLADETAGVAVPSTPVSVVTGGTPPYTYAADPTSGPMPDGLELSEDGAGNVSISGTPTTAGSYSFTIDVQDSGQ